MDNRDTCSPKDKKNWPLVQKKLCTSGKAEGDHYYTCARGESDPNSEEVPDSRHTDNQDHLQNPTNADIPRESELNCLGVHETFLTASDISFSLPTVNSNVNPPFASQPYVKGLCEGEEQTQTPRNALNECDMKQEETGTEHNMWKLRANCVEQILSSLNKEFGSFTWSRRVGLEFNVGFGPKQNISFDSLSNKGLLEIAKFALAMNSSQQDFIMEILEYNFDLGLQSQDQRNIFACEIMRRVRQLRSCEDAVKFSNEGEELSFPMPSINMTNLNGDSVISEVSNTSRMEKCDDATMCPPDSHADATEHISLKSVDRYPLCKEMGLKLHVNYNQPNKKLEINKLTNGAMTEVRHFAERLCGTFEQICLDILRHNFDLDSQSGDSEHAQNILAQMYAAMEQKHLSSCTIAYRPAKGTIKDISTMEKLDCLNNPNFEACSAGSSQAATINRNVGTSADMEHKDELDLKLWKLRANHIQHILSLPHEEHCPLYSYSRCKKLGIDFNVGSGVKQNLDPKLLTNGIMVELNTFATALLSATKHFITEILEHNFDLNLKNELYRSAFAQRTLAKISPVTRSCKSHQINVPFELPDMSCIQEPTDYCPKCYQDRNHKLHPDKSDAGHMDRSCPVTMSTKAQKPAKGPSSTFSTTDETIMDSYPYCKKIGLNLCVDKDQPNDKLDAHVLTRGIMMEVANFAKKLCGTKSEIIRALLEHNFSVGMQGRDINLTLMIDRGTTLKDCGLAWFNEVFVIRTVLKRQPGYSKKQKRDYAMERSERKETIQKRRLALQTKEERATLPSHNRSDVKTKTNNQNKGRCYPNCTEIGLDLDVTSASGEKEKLDLNLLTKAVVYEIHTFASQEVRHYYPRTVFDILDYNFDLSLQHGRRWEFSIATASKVQVMVKGYCKKQDGADEVFKLPFVFHPNTSQRIVRKRPKKSANSSLDSTTDSETSCLGLHAPFLTCTDSSSSLPIVNSHINSPFVSQPDKRGLCGGEVQTQMLRNVLSECDMEREEMGSENYYICPLGESDLSSDEDKDLGNTGKEDHSENPKSCSLSSDIPKESESSCVGVHVPVVTTTDVSSTLPSVSSNVNPPFAGQPYVKGLFEGEEQTQTPRNALNECDMKQEETGTEHNMWKLRANHVEQIFSPLNKEFGTFTWSRRVGLEFNVGFGPKQNISVDSLSNKVLLDIAKFALAMNSSQQYFIMEILEYNFDLGLQSQRQRNLFTHEIMRRVRELRKCEDAVKFTNQVFELPGPIQSINVTNLNVGSVMSEVSNTSRMEKCDDATMCPPDSHADATEHISLKSADCYPLCKEMGLKLHVNYNQPNKKLEINKLTNGALTEVTHFAERLCGTFEQICLDILRHNFDLDSQSGDSELAQNILARIPAISKNNLSSCTEAYRPTEGTRKDISTMEKLDCLNNPNFEACSAGSSQATIDQNVGTSADIEHKDELDLKLWKLRANHIQHILSIPHEEHCPLYSYSRCKKLGIDFNVGSGVKQNLDPKLLTNGIMVEFNTFATALLSARKFFIIEILEHHFDLNFENELDRSAFAQQIVHHFHAMKQPKKIYVREKILFQLPDMRSIHKPTYSKSDYCPKCYEDRKHKLHPDRSVAGHVHHPRPVTMTDTVSADANCTAQKPAKGPSSNFSTTEETIMDNYPFCKKIGFNLCVDKDQPRDKLDTHVLTFGIMIEVANFAKRLCGTKNKIIRALVEHNFSIGMQGWIDLVTMFHRATALKDGGLAWFNEVFVIRPVSHRQPEYQSKLKQASAMESSERKETIKKRRLALQTKEERATLPSHNLSVVKQKTNNQNKRYCYPICTEIGLDLDVTSTSGEKEKLDLNLLTTAVVYEIYKFATSKMGHYFPGTVFDILDYNFDLSSQHDRRWEFSITTASKVQTTAKRYRKYRDRPDKVFKLPFVFARKTSQKSVEKRQQKKSKKYSQGKPGKKRNKSRFVHQVRDHSDVKHVNFLGEPWSYDDDTNSPTDPSMMNEQIYGSLGCDSPYQGNIQFKEEEYDPHYGSMRPELDTEELYHSYYDDVKTVSYTGDVEHLVPGEPAVSLGYTITTMCPESESSIKTESEIDGVQYYILDEPQGSAGFAMHPVGPNSESNMKMEVDTACVKYLVPVEAAPSMITIDQCNERPLIKEEEEHLPI